MRFLWQYQMVQLLDFECGIAKVPLFNQVTNGKCRISEIADWFQQHITRTALKLDKLTENHTSDREALGLLGALR